MEEQKVEKELVVDGPTENDTSRKINIKRIEDLKVNFQAKQKTRVNNRMGYDFVVGTRDYINNHILLADTKAAFILGISSAVLYAIYDYYLKTNNIFIKNIKIWNFLDVITFLSVVFLMIAGIFAVCVVYPRLMTNKSKGLVSWVDISKYESITDLNNDFNCINEEELIKEINSVNYFLSKICKAKYLYLSFSFISVIVGTIGGLLILINL